MSERVIVTGGRGYTDRDVVFNALDGLLKEFGGLMEIAEGGAMGADHLARVWADRNDVKRRTFEARWDLDGPKAAGPIRNRRMLQEFCPTLVAAFPGNRGTANMMRIARDAGVPVREFS